MRTVALLVVATLAAFAMLASGCFARSEGQLGHASFAWQECLFGCSVTDNPMAAAGAQADIAVSLANGYSFNQLRSSEPRRRQLQPRRLQRARRLRRSRPRPGRRSSSSSTAPASSSIRSPSPSPPRPSWPITQGWTGAAPLVLEGSTQTFHVTTEDANDHTLIGTGAVSFDDHRSTAAREPARVRRYVPPSAATPARARSPRALRRRPRWCSR